MLIYTPGSNAGLPVSILNSFAAPGKEILEDNDLLRERISTTVSSLLGLVGIDADPIQSKEHIFLSTILDTAWRKGQNLDLAALIQQVQTPPVQKVGVLDIESFYPSKERFRAGHGAQQLVGLSRLQCLAGRNATGYWPDSLHPGRKTAHCYLLHRPSQRPGAYVLRLAAHEPGARMDAHTTRNQQLARDRLHG